ncbi:hypothetical protein [Streptomyces sp. NPDC096339]|uniref:hypothetical protein n=1 Tax=Streptomyces sp. NPDC096339 TaxID=3366086 RepID=UPI003814AE34
MKNWTSSADNLVMGLGGLAPAFQRDRAWYGSRLAHAYAAGGEAEAALGAALPVVLDASEVGRPHAWQELHKVAGMLLRQRAPQGRMLYDALATLD